MIITIETKKLIECLPLEVQEQVKQIPFKNTIDLNICFDCGKECSPPPKVIRYCSRFGFAGAGYYCSFREDDKNIK